MTTKLPDVIPEREILALLAQGEREIAEGVGYDLEEILLEADTLLREQDA